MCLFRSQKFQFLLIINKNRDMRTFYLSQRTCCNRKSFDSIPGPLSLPFIGTLYQYLPLLGSYKFTTFALNGLNKRRKFGPIVREQIVPGVNLVLLFNPEDIETLFRTEEKYPLRRSHLALEKYRLDRPHVYNNGGLLPTNGPEWYRLRSVAQKSLSSPSAVLNFLPASNEIIQEWLSMRLGELSNLRQPIDYLPELSRLFLELTGYIMLDTRFNSFSKNEFHPESRASLLMKSAADTNNCIFKLDNGPHLWRKFETPLYRKFRKAQQYMENIAIDILSLKISLYKDNDSPSTLLDKYLSSPELDFKDIIGIICDFLLAGIDTSSYSTSFLFYHLAKNPSTQQALYEESCKFLTKPNSPVTTTILREVSFAKAVLKESFRLNPISIGVGRVLQSVTNFSGYNIPKESVIVTQNQVSCKLEEYFYSPYEFKPERWLRSHSAYQKTHPYLLLPFGHGSRTCIARRLAEQNMIVLMLKVVRNYEIGWNGGCLNSKSLLINQPDGPILLTFKKR